MRSKKKDHTWPYLRATKCCLESNRMWPHVQLIPCFLHILAYMELAYSFWRGAAVLKTTNWLCKQLAFCYCWFQVSLINPLSTDDAIWHRLTLAAFYQLAHCFEDRFCARKKGRIGGGGWVSVRGAVHIAAAFAGCRKALVGNGCTFSHLVSTNRLRNHSTPLVGAPFLDL